MRPASVNESRLSPSAAVLVCASSRACSSVRETTERHGALDTVTSSAACRLSTAAHTPARRGRVDKIPAANSASYTALGLCHTALASEANGVGCTYKSQEIIPVACVHSPPKQAGGAAHPTGCGSIAERAAHQWTAWLPWQKQGGLRPTPDPSATAKAPKAPLRQVKRMVAQHDGARESRRHVPDASILPLLRSN